MQHTETITAIACEADDTVAQGMNVNKKWLVMAGFAVMVLSFLYVWISASYYSAEARILIDDWGVINSTPNSVEKAMLEERGLLNQIEIISSLPLLRSAGVATNMFPQNVLSNETSINLHDRLSLEMGVVSRLLGALKVSKTENSRIVSIQYMSKNPSQSIGFTNALADAYVSLLRGDQAHAGGLLPASARVLSRSGEARTLWAWWTWPLLALGASGLIFSVAAFVMPGLWTRYKEQNNAEFVIEPIETLIMPIIRDMIEENMPEIPAFSEALSPDGDVEIEKQLVKQAVAEKTPQIEPAWKETRLAA